MHDEAGAEEESPGAERRVRPSSPRPAHPETREPSVPDTPDAANGPAERDATPGLDELVSALVRESTLWPLLIVIVGSLGALGAALLVLVFVDRNPFAAGALLLVAGMTLDVGWRARSRPRLRPIAAGLGLVWCSAIALSALATWAGLA